MSASLPKRQHFSRRRIRRRIRRQTEARQRAAVRVRWTAACRDRTKSTSSIRRRTSRQVSCHRRRLVGNKTAAAAAAATKRLARARVRWARVAVAVRLRWVMPQIWARIVRLACQIFPLNSCRRHRHRQRLHSCRTITPTLATRMILWATRQLLWIRWPISVRPSSCRSIISRRRTATTRRRHNKTTIRFIPISIRVRTRPNSYQNRNYSNFFYCIIIIW